MNQKYIAFAAILILITANVFTGFLYFQTKDELARAQNAAIQNQAESKSLVFLEMLVAKVLQNEGEVSFDDRLLLENAVRQIGDPEILSEWTKFSNSQNESDAQESMKQLLGLLVKNAKAAK